MTDLHAAADFVWRHARLIDRHRFAHLFLGASAEPVVHALRGYRNEDGGFGHALEPDLRTPTSQPAAVQQALEILAEAGAFDDPMAGAACDFLAAIARPDGGIPFVLPTAAEHPRAPWWQPADASSLTQTAANAAVLHAQGASHPWLDRATAFCWARIEALRIDGAYDARFAVAFLDAVPDAARAAAALAALQPHLLDAGLVALDPAAHDGAGHTPLGYSPAPGARSRSLFAPENVDAHLDALAAGQQDDGGWTFDWPGWSPAATEEWRGVVTLAALQVLRANGRLGAPQPSHR
ncbi:MAG: hypothetical protein QOC64_3647 [Solirubrobacteraceae bacterium]|nr:hypothetical protein [Solirubrobacteraceae bacterium]